jgi:hypothetical protein
MNNVIPEWYSSFSVYIDFYNEMLSIYKKITKMSFTERYEKPFEVVKPIVNISTLISRIVPFRINENSKSVSVVDGENIDYLSTELSFVGNDIRQLISQYNTLLFELGAIRNKYEHIPHFVKARYVGGSNNASDVIFEIPSRNNGSIYKVTIATDDIEDLMVNISEIIFKVANYIVSDVEANYPEYLDYPYYKMLKTVVLKSNKFIKVTHN